MWTVRPFLYGEKFAREPVAPSTVYRRNCKPGSGGRVTLWVGSLGWRDRVILALTDRLLGQSKIAWLTVIRYSTQTGRIITGKCRNYLTENSASSTRMAKFLLTKMKAQRKISVNWTKVNEEANEVSSKRERIKNLIDGQK